MANDDGSVPEACLRNVVRLAEGLPAPNKVRSSTKCEASLLKLSL